MTEYHKPVLLKEAVDGLVVSPSGIYVDVTFGGGGHTREILKRLAKHGKVVALDRDADALEEIEDDPRLTVVKGNFRYLRRYLRLLGIHKVDGILADLGVSSHQFDEAARGFSYRSPGEVGGEQDDPILDMRMSQAGIFTAGELLLTYPETELVRIFSEYGEVRNSKTLAKAIIEKRKHVRIDRTAAFMRILETLAIGSRLRYFSQVFQALRIEINQELDALNALLEDAVRVLKPDGRLVVISYHSLEDRLVKNMLKCGNTAGIEVKDDFGRSESDFFAITKKPVEPNEEEVKLNPRARSAKLRIGQKQ